MESTMHPALPAFAVTYTLTRAEVSRTFTNVVFAPSAALARQLGDRIGQTSANGLAYAGADWTFDPDTVQVEQVGAGGLADNVGSLLAAVGQELAHSDHVQRVLAAIIARYGPLALTAAEIDAAVPAALAQVAGGEQPDTVWWVLPHQLHVPFAVGRLPEIPANGVVEGGVLHEHRGREVLVSSEPDHPSRHLPASMWEWRTIIDVRPHPAGDAWLMLHTDQGAQAIITAGSYSIRDPRPAPHPNMASHDG